MNLIKIEKNFSSIPKIIQKIKNINDDKIIIKQIFLR